MEEKIVKDRKTRQRGASLVEYALLVALIATIAIPAVVVVGSRIKCNLEKASDFNGSIFAACDIPQLPDPP